ncbi:lipoate--protein ligase [Lacrimispora saccharolytica]|uniref:lipoate--protein ligase n=1 Tax=Lacrimispora saccharolytica (strain ATCC 35040 / DSM 2544 / NRCC 2533 / WM1) TaxID=610130 RepID=D9R9S7_LACSW|nr:lipoate--protein ligase [Lacrimispora saccharolytica]ADL04127.1 lipoyltransferase and lipoate-protein ligase [[Clostridium] saccharolyticum WM1]QRV21583.1 lipoate--protein ligase [Lacrimispora saccharolytica]
MIQNIKYFDGSGFDPYLNLAIEEYLMETTEEDTCILYLWQNENTVVIGRNQNPWKECRIRELEEDGGHLVRRLSGGGAVFHDLGNLNFTFLVRKNHYDQDKQLEVILSGVRKVGIHAEKSGRNDITVSGRKFSGNAFYTRGEKCYHHGTLLVHADMQKLSQYLQVSKEKLALKGVDSVKSRVTNLSEYEPGLTIQTLKNKLLEAFEETYERKAVYCSQEDLDPKALSDGRKKFSSWDWLYGRSMDFQYELSKRFAWGNGIWQFQVNNGIVKDLQLFSDSMEPDLVDRIPGYIKGSRYEYKDICHRLDQVPAETQTQSIIINDLKEFFAAAEL